MTRTPRTPRRLPATAAFVALLLLGVLLATAGASAASSTAPTTDAVAQDQQLEQPDVPLEVTRTYHRTPDDQGTVDVEYVVTNPEVVQRSDVEEVQLNFSNVEYANPQGLTHVQDDTYSVDGSADQASVTLTVPVSDARQSERETDDYAQVVPLSIEGCQLFGDEADPDCGDTHGVVVESDGSATVEPAYTYEVAGSGFVTSGNSETVRHLDARNVDDVQYYPLVVMGEYDTATATEGGRTVTVVVPDALELRESPQTTADAVAAAAAELEAGHLEGERYLIARPDGDGFHGFAVPSGARWATVNVDRPVHTGTNTWVHEYVHTTDDMNLVEDGDESLSWFHEAYATYREQQLSMEAGYASYDHYRAVLEHGGTDASAGSYHDNYHSGPLLMDALDRKIQVDSGGDHDLDDLVLRLRNADDEATKSDISEILARLGHGQTAQFFEEATNASAGESIAFSEDSAPDPRSLATFQSQVDDVPNVNSTISNITVTSDRGTRTADTDGPLAVRPDATVEFEFTLENTGNAEGRYKLQLREEEANPLDSTPEVFDSATGTVAPGATQTVTLSKTFGEAGTETDLDVERMVPTDFVEPPSSTDSSQVYNPGYGLGGPPPTHVVNVVPENATIVRQNGPNDEVGHGAIVTADTETIVYRADSVIQYVYRPPVNVRVGKNTEYRTASNGVSVEDDPEDFSVGRHVKVSFGIDEIEDVQYLSSLQPVEGTSVPNDPDGDGRYEDVTGDGSFGHADIVEFYQNLNSSAVTDFVPAFDFDDDGDVDEDDVDALFEEMVDSY